VLNVLPTDIDYIDANYPDAELYDVILSRIQGINGRSLADHIAASSGSIGEFTREFNVTSLSFPLSSYQEGKPPSE
jgi:hypothetical protein